MKKLLVVVLCLAIPLTVFAADNGYKITYDGGSTSGHQGRCRHEIDY